MWISWTNRRHFMAAAASQDAQGGRVEVRPFAEEVQLLDQEVTAFLYNASRVVKSSMQDRWAGSPAAATARAFTPRLSRCTARPTVTAANYRGRRRSLSRR